MDTNHNRIKVADLEKNLPNKILTTNTNGELEFSDIINDLSTGGTTKVLTAEMGKTLNESIDALTGMVNDKQETLVSGTNIKTIEGQSLLGLGNIDLDKTAVGLSNVDNTSDANKPVSTAQAAADTIILSSANSYTDSKLSSVYKYKGSVANYASLPSTELITGDVYNTVDTGMNYSWTGSAWDALGTTVDISSKEDISNKSNNIDADKTSTTKYSTTKAVYDWGIGLFATDSNVVHKTGTESISGNKTFSNGGFTAINVSTNAGTPNNPGFITNGSAAATANVFEGRNNGTPTFMLNKFGDVTANSFIKSGGTSSQFLKANGSVDSNSYALTSQLHNLVTIGTANGLSLSTQVLSLDLASSSTNGALSSSDWNTFNGKQTQLNGTGFIKAVGTTISYDNTVYEPAFSKNSAFNKNFGTSTGTVVEGNDSRINNGQTAFSWGNHTGLYPLLSGSYTNPSWISSLPWSKITNTPTTLAGYGITDSAPSSGSENYIQANPSSAQSANMWIAGRGTFGELKYDQAIDISGGNLNSITDGGFYRGSGMGNAPDSGWFYVTIESHPGWYHQTVTSFGAGNTANRIYSRTNVGGTWSAWAEIFKNGDPKLLVNTTTDNGVDTLQVNGSGIFGSRISNTSGGAKFIGSNRPSTTLADLVDNAAINIGDTSTRWLFSSSNADGSVVFQSVDGAGSAKSFEINKFGGKVTIGSSFSDALLVRGHSNIAGNLIVGLDVTANAFYTTSDERLKNIIEVESVDVSKIKPINYTWKDKTKDQTVQLGYSAQEVQKVMPTAVSENTEGQLSVNYIQVLIAKINLLENKIKELEHKL